MLTSIRRAVGALVLRLLRFRFVDHAQTQGRSGVIIGAPHTSNWDLPIGLALAWRAGYRFKVLVKDAAFVGPFGPIARALGAIPVNRANPGGLTQEIVRQLAEGKPFFLGVAAEGTRSRGEYWKSGFYRIARDAGLPVTFGYLDTVTRTAGFGPTIELTGDVSADMDKVREFYLPKRGMRPGLETPPRLREEDRD